VALATEDVESAPATTERLTRLWPSDEGRNPHRPDRGLRFQVPLHTELLVLLLPALLLALAAS